MDDIFTRAGNRRRVYALSGFTVVYRVQGWYFKRTDHDEDWRGPFSTRYRSVSRSAALFARNSKSETACRLETDPADMRGFLFT